MPDYADVWSSAIDEVRITALSDISAVLCLSALTFYQKQRAWTENDEIVSLSRWDEIDKAIAQATLELTTAMIGLIFPYPATIAGNINALECDGSSYLREDYPLLYDVLDAAFIIDADNFRVPDLRSKFILGVDSLDYALGDEGGEKEHTLSVGEMPSHTHTNFPHTHTESGATLAPNEIGVGVPTPTAIPSPAVTGASSIDIDPTGGDEAHNNMPPFLALKFYIVAG